MERLNGIQLGAMKGSSLFICGLGDGGVGWNPPWGLGRAHRFFICGLGDGGLDGIHLGALEGLLAFRLRERFAGVHFGALDRQYPLVAVLGDGD